MRAHDLSYSRLLPVRNRYLLTIVLSIPEIYETCTSHLSSRSARSYWKELFESFSRLVFSSCVLSIIFMTIIYLDLCYWLRKESLNTTIGWKELDIPSALPYIGLGGIPPANTSCCMFFFFFLCILLTIADLIEFN